MQTAPCSKRSNDELWRKPALTNGSERDRAMPLGKPIAIGSQQKRDMSEAGWCQTERFI
ncbi:hypothetical protein D3C84_1213200 [compost metagenome]